MAPKKRVPDKDTLLEAYYRLLSVQKTADEFGLAHSTVWRRIGPVLERKRAVRRPLAGKPEGMSIREWARKNGVSPSTVCYWRRQYENQRAAQREIKDTDAG
jgi:DNA invertase Pin-like site-specific DNA recombinase